MLTEIGTHINTHTNGLVLTLFFYNRFDSFTIIAPCLGMEIQDP